MSSKSLLIVNASIVNEGQITQGDVFVRDGRIEKVGFALTGQQADRVIDARGRHLLPGMIDDQVHFREPGLTHKGDIATESAAAAAGGITSFMDMPNSIPQTISRAALADKYLLAAGRARANFAFYLGGANDNIEEIKAVRPEQTCGVKVFMGASTGNMLVDDPAVLEQIFAHCPLLIATHCEDPALIRENERQFAEQYGDDIPPSAHALIRSGEACYRSSSLAVELARRHDARLHVLHLTTAREMDLFAPGPLAGKRITAEVCVHHLCLDDTKYAELGNLMKCNPAVKTPADRRALLQALQDDRIDVVATDHAPHPLREKEQPYRRAPSGLPLAQHALPLMLEHFHDGALSLETIVRKTSHAVAELFGIRDRGYIREGYWADLVLVDLNRSEEVRGDDCLYKVAWSPFEGMTLRSQICATMVNGVLVWEDGGLTGETPGRRLECNTAR
ncbi:MAG: dihydroorotase [Gammaproteobacteria bacterium]|nr:MAG: dihydroorotase [Gammaproteobacteria bacterium]